MSYLVPTVIEQSAERRACLRHLLPPAEGSHRRPRHRDQRHQRQPAHRPAPAPRSRGSRPGHLPLHQQPGRIGDRHPWHLRHHAGHRPRRLHRVPRAWPPRARRCCWPAGPPASGWPCRTARVLIHQPHGGAQGQSIDIENQAREIAFLRGRLEEILASTPVRPRERIAADTDRDYILGAEGAVEYGLVDEVLQPRRLKVVPRLPEVLAAAGGGGAAAPAPAPRSGRERLRRGGWPARPATAPSLPG